MGYWLIAFQGLPKRDVHLCTPPGDGMLHLEVMEAAGCRFTKQTEPVT